MRLWHTALIPYLPSKLDYKGSPNQLGGQWVEIRMILSILRNKGKVNHSVVNYVNNYPVYYLYAYGLVVSKEMKNRGFDLSNEIVSEYLSNENAIDLYNRYTMKGEAIFREHNNDYLLECLENLKNKGINLSHKVAKYKS